MKRGRQREGSLHTTHLLADDDADLLRGHVEEEGEVVPQVLFVCGGLHE